MTAQAINDKRIGFPLLEWFVALYHTQKSERLEYLAKVEPCRLLVFSARGVFLGIQTQQFAHTQAEANRVYFHYCGFGY
jgi:hypothetical protein